MRQFFKLKIKLNLVLVIILFSCLSNSFAQNFDWVTKIGEADNDKGYAITSDKYGNVYTTGYIQETPLKIYPLNTIFIQKIDINGNIIWTKEMEDSSDYDEGRGYAIAVDDSGNVYATGYIAGTVDFNPASATYYLSSGSSGYCSPSIFIVKLNSDGDLLWAKLAVCSYDPYYFAIGNSIAIDKSGNVYTSGEFFGTVDFDPGLSNYNLTFNGGINIFVEKLDASGNFVWAKQMGGENNNYCDASAYSMAIDNDDNIYTTGYFDGTVDFDPGTSTYDLTATSYDDIYIEKLDPDGNFVWVKQMESTSYSFDNGFSIAVDTVGNIYSTGIFTETVDFNPGSGTYNLTSTGEDIFILKLNKLGDFVWAKQIEYDGGSEHNYRYRRNSLDVDIGGNIYTTGYFDGTVDFDPNIGTNYLTSNNLSFADMFILKLDSDGDFEWVIQMQGIDYISGYYPDCYSNAISVDPIGNIFTTGSFSSTVDFDPGLDTFDLDSWGGKDDIFILKINQCNSIVDTSVQVSTNTLTANVLNATYQWMDCYSNSPINGAVYSSFIPTANGQYAVQIILDGCIDTSSCYTISNAGIIEPNFLSYLKVYPNPTTNKFSIDLGSNYEEIVVSINDVIGNKMKKLHFKNMQLFNIDMNDQLAGVYFVTIKTKTEQTTIKLVKE